MLKTRLLTAVSGLIALLIALGATASLSAQSSDVSVELRVAARVDDRGRVEFALRDVDKELWTSEKRFLSPLQRSASVGRWLRSGVIEIGAVTARVNAMPREDGAVEFAIEVDGDRHEPTANILTVDHIEAATDRWLYSTPVTITVRVSDRAMRQLEVSGGTRFTEAQCTAIYNKETLRRNNTGVLYTPLVEFSSEYLMYLVNAFQTEVDQKPTLHLARRAVDRYDLFLTQCRDVTLDLRADAYALSLLRQRIAEASRNPLNAISPAEERCLTLQHGETVGFAVGHISSREYGHELSIDLHASTSNIIVHYPVLSYDLMRHFSLYQRSISGAGWTIARYVLDKAGQFIDLCDGTLELSFDGEDTKAVRIGSETTTLLSYLYWYARLKAQSG